MAAKAWISTDESAKEMLSRIFMHRHFFSHLPPPLHRVPLRLTNVLELVGPSPSAKTHALMQVAVNCILPEEWKGVRYEGLGRGVVFLDLDCRFDVLRLAELLRQRIIAFRKGSFNVNLEPMHASGRNFDSSREMDIACDEDLFAECMRRFLYIRCYDSFEFLSTLKTLHYQLQKAEKEYALTAHFLMIDSIGAFYWVDRASTSLPLGGDNRKKLSLQSVLDSVVQEIRNLLLVHPMLVIATKSTILAERLSANEVKGSIRNAEKGFLSDSSHPVNVSKNTQPVQYREYMPSVWQSFVTHRVLLRAADLLDNCVADNKRQHQTIYVSEWLLPSLSYLDKYVVTDAGISTIS